ncbi:hypothetical protein [Listeria monocytogenes]|uniref:hypothetical protein n=1 Tax=Listeria monocytogenes TaxID=1639 RepID=UPI001CA62CDF|nr:hypothetical protein [Listeria monocytogenes]
MTKSKKWCLFISSYLPLYVLLLISFLFNNKIPHEFREYFSTLPAGIVVLFLLILFSITVILKLIILKKGNERIPITENYSSTGDNVISYVMTYIIPMLSLLDNPNAENITINILLFIFIGVVYVSNDLVYLNPILAFLGYHIFESDKGTLNITRLTLGQLDALKKEGTKVMRYKVATQVFLIKRIKKRNEKKK